jgi:hypothetical protein
LRYRFETPKWRGRLALTEDAARLIEATNAA